jgi:hypothetical protein
MKRIVLGMLVVLVGTATAFGVAITDDFSDNDYTNDPTWVVDSGLFSADGTVVSLMGIAGMLNFGTAADTAIYLDFDQDYGPVLENTTVEISFVLAQTNGTTAPYEFKYELIDTDSGQSLGSRFSPNPATYGGTSGFSSWDSNGNLIAGVSGASLGSSGWANITLIFDPSAQQVTVKMNDVVVAVGPNYLNLTKVNRLKLISGGTVSWYVDNVHVEYSNVENPTDVVMDRFFDNDYTNDPTWVVDSGLFSADGSTSAGNFCPAAGMLNFGTAVDTTIHLDFDQDFGPVVENTPVEISFHLSLRQNGSPCGLGRWGDGWSGAIRWPSPLIPT